MPVYLSHDGARNFLWFCDIANFVLAAGLWIESPLLISWQAVSVPAVQLVWTFDLLAHVALGSHPIGAAAYMSDPSHPLLVRGFSLFHMAVPLLMIWGLARLGMAGYPLLLYTPSHGVLRRIFPTASAGTGGRRGASPAAR